MEKIMLTFLIIILILTAINYITQIWVAIYYISLVKDYKNGVGYMYSSVREKMSKNAHWAQNKQNIKNLMIPWGILIIGYNLLKQGVNGIYE
jgi:hypothetical protein